MIGPKSKREGNGIDGNVGPHQDESSGEMSHKQCRLCQPQPRSLKGSKNVDNDGRVKSSRCHHGIL
jgi:hypothetical protein